MLQVARLAPKLLGESAETVATFVRGQLNPDGGFKDRAGQSDLYYTVFGIDALLALRADLPIGAVYSYLQSFGGGQNLDLIHLGCLARCWASLPPNQRVEAPADGILARVEEYRSGDGGYAPAPAEHNGTIYASFVAAGAYDDLARPMPDALRLIHCLNQLQAEDGGYANQRDMPLGLTPSTAAAVALLRHLDQPLPPALGDWLLARCRPEGGFYATPIAPLPDLLSTAIALHALGCLHVSLDAIREPCLDFLDSLWTNRGAFHGSWADDIVDCEYTYYALLSLGHLSL
jgi:hypothetical protein